MCEVSTVFLKHLHNCLKVEFLLFFWLSANAPKCALVLCCTAALWRLPRVRCRRGRPPSAHTMHVVGAPRLSVALTSVQ